MSGETDYKYYTTTAEKRAELSDKYSAETLPKRNEVIKGLLDNCGAVAYCERNNFGAPASIYSLIFEHDSPMKNEKWIRVSGVVSFQDVAHLSLIGKNNYGKGKAFNQSIADTNKSLELLPNYKDWLIKHFGVMQTAITSHCRMLSTNAGTAGDVLVFSIPISEGKAVQIPGCFSEITYGQYYDLVNEKGE